MYLAFNQDAAGGRFVNAADEVEEGGFAASAGTGNGQKFPGANTQAGVVESGNVAVVERKPSADSLRVDEFAGFIHGVLLPFRSSTALTGR